MNASERLKGAARLRSAGRGIGAAILATTAATAAWLGFRAHEHHNEEERDRLQAEYVAAKANGNPQLNEKNEKIMSTIQDLGRSNPDGRFAHRFSKKGAAAEMLPEDIARQPEIDING